jgi:hypothetical protein
MMNRIFGVHAVGLGLSVLALTGCLGARENSEEASSEAALQSTASAAYCRAIQDVTLSNLHVESGWTAAPSEDPNAILTVTVTNEGSEDSVVVLGAYPAVRITFDPPVAALQADDGSGVFAMTDNFQVGVPRTARLRIVAKPGVVAGTRVRISAAMADNRSPFDHCASDGPATTGEATIGAE